MSTSFGRGLHAAPGRLSVLRLLRRYHGRIPGTSVSPVERFRRESKCPTRGGPRWTGPAASIYRLTPPPRPGSRSHDRAATPVRVS